MSKDEVMEIVSRLIGSNKREVTRMNIEKTYIQIDLKEVKPKVPQLIPTRLEQEEDLF